MPNVTFFQFPKNFLSISLGRRCCELRGHKDAQTLGLAQKSAQAGGKSEVSGRVGVAELGTQCRGEGLSICVGAKGGH